MGIVHHKRSKHANVQQQVSVFSNNQILHSDPLPLPVAWSILDEPQFIDTSATQNYGLANHYHKKTSQRLIHNQHQEVKPKETITTHQQSSFNRCGLATLLFCPVTVKAMAASTGRSRTSSNHMKEVMVPNKLTWGKLGRWQFVQKSCAPKAGSFPVDGYELGWWL